MADAASGDDDGATVIWSCSKYLEWIVDVIFLPCKPILPLLLPSSTSSHLQQHHYVTLTLLCNRDVVGGGKVCLCIQDHPAGPPLLLLDLPITAADAAKASRVTLECNRGRFGGDVPLLATPAWQVFVNGLRVGFGTRRASSPDDAWTLAAVKSISAGAGVLPPLPSDGAAGGGFMYVRGRFKRVVGSADSESYHLVDPAGRPVGADEDLSFFFLRV